MAYGSDAGLVSYCTARGYDISALATEAARDGARARASTFVDGLGYMGGGYGVRIALWPGKPLVAGQVAEWPRTGARDAYGQDVPETVPERIENATYEASYQIAQGVDLNLVRNPMQTVLREKVDVIEQQFADASQITAEQLRVSVQSIETLVAPLIGGGRYPTTMVLS